MRRCDPRMPRAQFHDFATAAQRTKQGAMHAPTEPQTTDDRDFDWRLLAPLIAHVIFTHVVIAVVRVSDLLPLGRAGPQRGVARRDLRRLRHPAGLRGAQGRPLHRPRLRRPCGLDRRHHDAGRQHLPVVMADLGLASPVLHHPARHRPHVPDGLAADADAAQRLAAQARVRVRLFHGGDLDRPGARPADRRLGRPRHDCAADRPAVRHRRGGGRAVPRLRAGAQAAAARGAAHRTKAR